LPNIKSAKKRARQNIKRREANQSKKAAVRTFEKKVRKLASEGKLEEASKSYSIFTSLIDKAAKRNIYHKNTVARKKSRIAIFLQKLMKQGVKKEAPIAEPAEVSEVAEQ